MEIVMSVAAKIAEYTVEPACRQLGYLFRYPANVDNLKIRMQDLKDARERLQHRVDEARNNCEEIEADVQNWLNNVDKISLEAETFLSHGDHAKVECSSCGSVLHLVTRHQFSRKAKKMSTEVCAVDKKKFDGIQISYRLHRQASYSAITKGYETFDSRKGILESIMEAVRDANRSRIGLHGMAGIGKTLLANEIARQAKKEKLFSKVIIITISQTPNEEAIQQHIADMLELKFGETDNTKGKRATLLQQRLKQENKILLILDDIWKELNLKEIGIHDECQMLLTSRTRHVLRNSMGVAESNVFFLQPLDPLEATSLFKKIIGEIVENADYKSLACQIVAECAGLPVSIATVAHALKCNMELSIWQDALHRLRSSGFMVIEGMDEKVYLSIRFSYDFLGIHEEAKSLLLLCALHKEDAEIEVEDLMRYSVGCRLLQGVNTVKEARNRVYSLVDKLKSHCLLLDGRSKSYVKMHDVIRDVCILIAKEDEHRINSITSATTYEEFVLHERHKVSNAISFLDYDDLNKLPEKLECPTLKLLLLSGRSIQSIPVDFFEQTKKLEALVMGSTRLESLPPSFHFLQNLQTLCLLGSSLEDIAVIGELKNLKVLDLSWSFSIKLLPKEIGELRRLQLLDLQGCSRLSVIEPNVISNLTQMEELYLPTQFLGWEIEEGSMKERRNASLIEIKSLQLLTVLSLSVTSENILPEKLFSEKLERYQVSIGGDAFSRYIFQNEFPRWLQLNLLNMNEKNASGLKSLIKRSEYLSLETLVDVTNVVHDLDKDGFPRLKHLRLIQLTSLERICHGKLPTDSFKELRKVDVRNCGRLKNLFPLSVTKLLHGIRVEKCEMMEEIVSHGRENEGNDEASHNIDESFQLRFLFLHSLPKFAHFYFSKLKTTGESSLVDYSKSLFNDTVSFANLEILSLKKLNIEKLWAEQLLSNSYMQNLTSLEVGSCDNLKYMFSFTLTQCFVNLRSLKVGDCKAMEDICVTTKKFGEEESQLEMILFPKLESIELDELSALQRFCATDSCMKFPLLSKLTIKDCPKLKTFVSSSTISIQVSVDHKEVNQLVSVEPFFNEKIAFPNLKDLYIWNCNNIKYLLSSVMARSLVQLEKLIVLLCENLEEVIVSDEESGNSESKAIIFEKLKSLRLENLPNVIKFCGRDDIKCPMLSRLEIWNCPKVKEFISNSMGTRTCTASEEMSIMVASKPSLFNDKIAFPNLKEFTVSHCNNIKYLLSSVMARSLVQLKKLSVKECENIEEVIVSDEESGGGGSKSIIFEKLESLELKYLPNVIKFCEGYDIECPLLSELSIDDCPKLKEFISNSMDTRACTASEEMGIMVASKQSLFNDKIAFPNLKKLTIWVCNNIKYLLSSVMARSLVQLETLQVCGCEYIEEVIVSDEESGGGGSKAIIFEKLESLEFNYLPNVIKFCEGNCIKCPLLSRLAIKNCPKMKEFINNSTGTRACTVSEEMGMVAASKQSLFNDKIAFPNLKELTVWNCNNIKYLLSFAMARSLVQLKKLKVYSCENIEEVIVSDEESGGGGSKSIIFEKLESLQLEYLPNIIKFCEGDCIECPLLPKLGIVSCPKLKEFISNSIDTRVCTASEEMGIMVASKQSLFNDKVSFANLEILEVGSCDNLKYMFSITLAQCFVNLRSLKVGNCKAMEDICVTTKKFGEEESQLERILFPKLESIELDKLSALQRFCTTDSCMEFPLLSKFIIKDCRKEMNQLVPAEPFFNGKIAFPNLKELHVWNCNNIKYLLSSAMARSLVQLKTLEVWRCENIEKVIVSDEESGGGGSKAIIFEKLESPQLKYLPNIIKFCGGDCIECPLLSRLEIWDCPKLKEFISNSMGTRTCTASEEMGIMVASKQSFFNDKIAFPNLKELNVWNCNNIKYLLSSSMARSLVQLKSLDVFECENIEEVIVGDEESIGGGSKAIVFEKLESLEFKGLPNVIKFCEGDCIECPLLSILVIKNCPKMKEFISNSTGTRACTVSEEMSMVATSKQSLFNNKVIFPNLKELEIDLSGIVNEIFEITSSQSSSLISTFVPNLSKLKVTCTSLDKPIAISDVKLFLHKYHNIHTLGLSGSFVDGQQQQPGDELINNTSLMKLDIYSAHKLNHLFGDPEYAQPSHTILFQNLKSLSVEDCSRLQSFAHSFMSFQKLETLTVKKCNGLTYLFSSSTAATLVQLKEMRIINCRRMREVINTDYYNDEKCKIEAETEHHHFVFHTLQRLHLYHLPSLQSFYSGNKVMSFPNLEYLSLGNCPKIRRFSHGIINISTSLKTIKVDGKKVKIWERDLNTTARRLWKETDDGDDDEHCQGNE
ncbi:uncharacterized protein LOC133781369 [Humulus lupulus]|uniref:uncharacterized protein LOC133781369 n=1 Tax=Humulus lupulus TaxID=3486 RepID=UPI002B4167A4|nr:uncharacterized protein LOC133781369 [Humulus lupulus]